MREYINRKDVLEEINDAISNIAFTSPYQNDISAMVSGMERIADIVADALAEDVVEVVRCKDCKHLNVLNRKDIYAHCPKTNTVFPPFELDTRTHFCSYGERKDNV